MFTKRHRQSKLRACERLERRDLLAVDLAVQVKTSAEVVYPGDEVSLVITVRNVGETVATGARLTADFADALNSLVWSNGDLSGHGSIDTLVDLEPRSRTDFKVDAVAGREYGDFNSTVEVIASDSQTDNDPTNNAAIVDHQLPLRTQIPRYIGSYQFCSDAVFGHNDAFYFLGLHGISWCGMMGPGGSRPIKGHLWRTDGTTGGTHQIKVIPDEDPREFEAFPVDPQFTEHRGILYFVAEDGIHGRELWRSDGTDGGTYLVKDINPIIRTGTTNFGEPFDYNDSSNIERLQVLDDELVFTAVDESERRKSWVSDGTEQGTLVREGLTVPQREPASLSPYTVTYEDEKFYRSEGTSETRELLADWPTYSRYPRSIFASEDTAFFNDSRDGQGTPQLLALDLDLGVDLPDAVTLDLKTAPQTAKSFATELIDYDGSFLPCEYFPCKDPNFVLGNNTNRLSSHAKGNEFDSLTLAFPGPIVDGPGDDITFGLNLAPRELFAVMSDGSLQTLKADGRTTRFDLRDFDIEEPIAALEIRNSTVSSVEATIDASFILAAKASNNPDLEFSWDLDGNGIFGDQMGRSIGLTIDELEQFGIARPGEFEIRVKMNDRVNDYFDTMTLTVVDSRSLPFIGTLQRIGGSGDGSDVDLADLDGDGDLDMFRSGTDAISPVWSNDGTGFFTELEQQTEFVPSVYSALGDLDGDGDVDALVMAASGNNRVYLNDGDGQFTDSGQEIGDANVASIDVALGDLDRDGDLDAFISNANESPNWVFLNDGTGQLVDSGQRLGAASSKSAEVADFDGDGDLDVAVANSPRGNAIWLNDGSGEFRAGQRVADGGEHIAAGDIDRDGDIDLVNASKEMNYIWLNDGRGHFRKARKTAATDLTSHIVLGDLDGDGDLDIVAANWSGNPSRVWFNSLLGQEIVELADSGLEIDTDLRSEHYALGDLDGDGDLDLVAGISGASDRIYFNQIPQGITGDINGDGEVSFADFLILAENFGKEDAERSQGDLNGDHRVSFVDFLELASNFGRKR